MPRSMGRMPRRGWVVVCLSAKRGDVLLRRPRGCRDQTPSGRMDGLTAGVETIMIWVRVFRAGSGQVVVVVVGRGR